MIIKNDEHIRLEFGTGDICIAGGYSDKEDNKEGFVIFTQQEPREIGSEGVIKEGEINPEEYPIIMTFAKKESIDAVIGQLEKAKSFME